MHWASVTEVYGGQVGTGHVVGPDLVLSASHPIVDGQQVAVRPAGDDTWREADVVWRDAGDRDAVLLRTRHPLPAAALDPHLRWGAVASAAEPLPCRATGFPAVQAHGGVRDTDTFSGQTVPGANLKEDRLVIQAGTGPRNLAGSATPWAGFSGAAVFSAPQPYLLGVVQSASAGYPNNRLKVVPAPLLLADPQFRALVGDPPLHLVARSGVVLHPPYLALPARHPDSWLLDGRFAVVDFVDDGQVERLTKWAEHPDDFRIAAVTGSGGMGKSRLASELAMRLIRRGWAAGYLNVDNEHGWTELAADRPLLVVVDYASRYTDSLAALVDRLADGAAAHPVRLLVVERRLGAWWNTVDRLTRRRAGHLLTDHVVLHEEALTPDLAGRHLDHALTALGDAVGAASTADVDVRLDGLTSPLLIHVAALLALRDRAGAGTDGAPVRHLVMQRLLDREIERWAAALPAHGLDTLHPAQAHRLVAVASLLDADRTGLRRLLLRRPGLVAAGDAEKVVEWLSDMFGAPDGAILPLGPDPIVEHLLETTGDLAELVLDLVGSGDLTPVRQRRILHLLTLAAQDGAAARTALTALLASRLPAMLEPLADSEDTEFADLLADALGACDRTDSTLSAVAAELAPAVPGDRERLAGLRTAVLETAIVRLRRRAPGRISQVRAEQLVDERAEAYAKLGAFLNDLGTSLGHLTRWGKALAATLEAVEIFAVLSRDFGNRADRRQYAVALSHASKFFRNLDMHDESVAVVERATRLWRALARADPGEREDLGIALTNLADSYCSAGRPNAAIRASAEAIAILRSELRRGNERAKPRLERALSEAAHHHMEIRDAATAWAYIKEAAESEGFAVGEDSGDGDLHSVGYLNGLAARLALLERDFPRAQQYAVLSASAYGRCVQEDPGDFFYFRGSLQLLVEVLDAAGETGEAEQIRTDLPHLLAEPDAEDYAVHRAEFEALLPVVEAV